MTPTDIQAWLILGVITAATDMVMTWRRLHGKLGPEVRASYLDFTRRVGGTHIVVALSIVFDIAVWPLGLLGCLIAYISDWRTYRRGQA